MSSKEVFNSLNSISHKNGWFLTSPMGGIGVNVRAIIEKDIRHWRVQIKSEYLKNLTISEDVVNITGKIILISNFGVVDGHSQFLKEKNSTLKEISLYEYKDVYSFFQDFADTNYRIEQIWKQNFPKYNPLLLK